jgi:hypothetical protein
VTFDDEKPLMEIDHWGDHTGRFHVYLRNLYMPRDWVPADPAKRLPGAPPQRCVPRHQLVMTEYWVIEITPDAAMTVALLNELEINRINSRLIKRKVRVGHIYSHDPAGYLKAPALVARCEAMARWLHRCGFWPFDI